jgi:hypothetical protein
MSYRVLLMDLGGIQRLGGAFRSIGCYNWVGMACGVGFWV